jgi:predicted RNA-binding Zn-ribbon protein involved in translation (DUF1610 family)
MHRTICTEQKEDPAMEAQCTKCGMQLTMAWSFCPHCGGAIGHEALVKREHVDADRTSAPGGFGGLMFGLLIAPVMIIVGTMLCLTGLGAILGIPMILGAVMAPLIGPMLGLGAHKGKCPECGMVVTTMADGKTYDCPACNRRFAVSDHPIAKAS